MPTVIVGVVIKAQRRALSRSGRAPVCFIVIVTRLQLTQPIEVGLHVRDIGVSIIASGRNFLTPSYWGESRAQGDVAASSKIYHNSIVDNIFYISFESRSVCSWPSLR